jgi:hypothetical protein
MGISGGLNGINGWLMEGDSGLGSYGKRRRKVEGRRKENVLLTGLLM